MPTFDPDIQLKSLLTDTKRLCFYPSSGTRLLSTVMRLNADVFIFSDYRPADLNQRRNFWAQICRDFRRNDIPMVLVKATARTRLFRSGDKWGFLFFHDNNEALARIAASGWKIDLLVGINDGCSEGGNYECVHEDPFLGKLLLTAANPMTYFTDHSARLVDPEKSRLREHTFFLPRMTHSSGAEFLLQRLIVKTNAVGRTGRQLRIHHPAQHQHAAAPSPAVLTDTGADAELLKLSAFRRKGTGVIAAYQVRNNPG
jgi:hypothetical protein